MPETISEDKTVSLRSFQSLYDQYVDFCRKLRFFVTSAFTMEEELLALEIISEFLKHKEKDLQEMRAAILGRTKGDGTEQEPVELLVGRLLMQHEDYRTLQRISEIRKNGGVQWEMLQAIIQEQAAGKDAHPPASGDE